MYVCVCARACVCVCVCVYRQVCMYVCVSFMQLMDCALIYLFVEQVVAPVALVLQMLFGGFYVSLSTIPAAIAWLKWISMFKYSFAGTCAFGWQRLHLSAKSACGIFPFAFPSVPVCIWHCGVSLSSAARLAFVSQLEDCVIQGPCVLVISA